MNDFYNDKCDFYLNSYWNRLDNNILTPNGFTQYPHKEYDCFVDIIDRFNLNKEKECCVMDICCGNGLLLKHLIKHCHSQVIPFGIDFLRPSIEQASKEILPYFSHNFFVSNAVVFDFSEHIFDFVLLDPYHFIDIDLVKILPAIIKQTRNSIIFYTYADVLRQTKLDSVVNFPALENINDLEVFNYKKISIAVLHY